MYTQLEISIVTLLIRLEAFLEYIEFLFERFVTFALRSWPAGYLLLYQLLSL